MEHQKTPKKRRYKKVEMRMNKHEREKWLWFNIYRFFLCFLNVFLITLQWSHLRGAEIWVHFLGSRRESTHWHQPGSIKPGSQSNPWMELTDSCISGSCFEAYNSNTFQLSSHAHMLFLKASECPDDKWLQAFLFLSCSTDRHTPAGTNDKQQFNNVADMMDTSTKHPGLEKAFFQ